MKKYLILSLAASSFLFAASDADIKGYLKNQLPSKVQVNVQKREALDIAKGFEVVNVELSDGKHSQNMVIFTKDNLIFPDIHTINDGSLLQKYMIKASGAKLKNTYEKEDKKYIISMGNDPKKETLVVFTDPECPYCREELNSIEEQLEKYNVKYILTSVHKRTAFEKEVLIYEELKNAKTDADKIKILRKYYDKNVKYDDKNIKEEDIKNLENLARKYFDTGAVRGTPTVLHEKDILQ